MKFTTDRWEKALTAVFVKSISDPEYRQLCLTNARAAVAAVAPDLELPEDFHFKFAAQQQNVLYSYLLPPPFDCDTDPVAFAEKVVSQNATGLTHPPTNTDDGGDDDDDDDDGTKKGGGKKDANGNPIS